MKVSFRALAIMAASASLVAVPLATSASAAASPACTKLTTVTKNGNLTATLSGCTPTAATGGKGTGSFKSNPNKSGTFNLTITWTAKKGTTKASVKFGPNKTLGKCPKAKGASRVTLTGSVSGGTGTALTTIKKGQKVTGSVCTATGKGFTVEPGTTLKF